MERDDEQTMRRARMVLDFNWTGEYTQPGPRLYPHQWSWDSALIAIAYAHYDQNRAEKEFRHLFEAQWKMFLEYAFPKLAAWHEYLYRERDPREEGLVYIRHPWESGMDNSPIWDVVLQRLQLRPEEVPRYNRADTHTVSTDDRPTSDDYDRFAYLVKFFADRDYDERRIREECPFLVQDMLFNSLLCRSGTDLAQIARIVGEDPTPFEERARKTAGAVNDKLWDEVHSTYLDFDLVEGRLIHAYTAPNFCALFAGIPDKERAGRMVESLKSNFGLAVGGTPVASYDVYGFGFSPVRYWRGPVWINIDWFLMHGLRRYGYEDLADRLRQTIIDLCREQGFHEYFNPMDGSGHGSDLFSWSAALFIDVLMEEGR